MSACWVQTEPAVPGLSRSGDEKYGWKLWIWFEGLLMADLQASLIKRLTSWSDWWQWPSLNSRCSYSPWQVRWLRPSDCLCKPMPAAPQLRQHKTYLKVLHCRWEPDMKRDSLSEMSAVCHVVSGRQRPQNAQFSTLVLHYRLGFEPVRDWYSKKIWRYIIKASKWSTMSLRSIFNIKMLKIRFGDI